MKDYGSPPASTPVTPAGYRTQLSEIGNPKRVTYEGTLTVGHRGSDRFSMNGMFMDTEMRYVVFGEDDGEGFSIPARMTIEFLGEPDPRE